MSPLPSTAMEKRIAQVIVDWMNNSVSEGYVVAARAAIRAMAEPTDEMRDAVYRDADKISAYTAMVMAGTRE